MKKLMIIMMVVFFGCADHIDSTDSENIKNDSALYSLSGLAQDGPCLSGGNVWAYPLLESDLTQNGEAYQTVTINDYGKFEIGALIKERYIEVFVDAACFNEITGDLMENKILSAIVDMSSDSANNVSPLTTIRTPRIRELYNDLGSRTYLDFNGSLDQSESEILSFFRMPMLDSKFTDLSLENSGIGDAVLLAVNSMMLWGRVESEQISFMTDIGSSIRDIDSISSIQLRAELKTAEMSISPLQIKENLESRYRSLGLANMQSPEFWGLLDSDGDGVINSLDPDSASLMDLIVRVPTLQKTLNLDDACSAYFDTDGFNWFAIPFRFDSSITLSKYIGLNLDGDISIYTRTFDVYDKPGILVFTPAKIKDNFFTGDFQDTTGDTYSNLPNGFHGSLADHSLVPGTDYYIVIRREESWRLSKSCGGPLTVFGRVLASTDGVDWIGFDNSTPFFRRQGIKMFLTN